MSSCAELLDQLKPAQHVVQLYGDDDQLLISNVGRYLAEGLRRGDGLLVIATPAHRTSLAGHLRQEAGYSKAVLEGRLVFLDARLTLNRFLVDGAPDPALFRSVVGESIRTVQARGVHTGVRAYGEMVGLLWQDGLFDQAAHLEELWNELLAQSEVSLFCAYPLDVLGPEFHPHTVDAVLSSHTHLLPVDPALAGALERAMDEVLGQSGKSLRPLLQPNHRPSWGEIPPAEALVLWLRNKLPDSADQILARTREHYQPAVRGLA